MKIEVKLVIQREDSNIIKNMYPLYLHDLSGIHGVLPNKYGIFEEADIKTLEEQYDVQQIWFEHPEELFPYLIIVDDIPAGFCLVGSGKYVPKGIDFYVFETFLLNPFRGKSISFKAILDIFDKHSGKWMFYTHATDINNRAKGFWCKTLLAYTSGNYVLEKQIIDNMPKLVFTFEN